MRPFRGALFAAFALLVLVSCGPQAPAPKVQERNPLLDTVITLSLFGDPPDSVYTEIFDELGRFDPWISDFNAQSEVSRISAAAGVGSVKVSSQTMAMVKRGLTEAALTKGIFDPTIGPVTHLWDMEGNMTRTANSQPAVLPTAAQIAAAKTLVGWQDVVVDETAGTVALKRKGMILDLGGIAKGFALDDALAIARKDGVTAGIINMGNSSIGLLGSKPGNKAWRIGLQDPFQGPGAYFAVVEGSEMMVETSGPYQKSFTSGGHRYHHIMDPRTGAPAESGLEQVTLLLPLDTQLSDGLSTTCFILGLKDGMALIESLPDAAAVFVTSDKKAYLSSRVGSRFSLVDKSFTVAQP